MEFRKKHQSSKNFIWFTFLAIFVLIGGFLVYENAKLLQKRSELLQKTRELKSEITRFTQEGVALQAAIAENQTLEYQEKILREQGLYQKPGEQVVTILPPQTQTQLEQKSEKRIWWDPRTWFLRD